MSEKMSTERADGLLNKHWASDNFQRDYVAALETVLEQAEQIKRLQQALRKGIGIKDLTIYDLLSDGSVTAEDMKGTQ